MFKTVIETEAKNNKPIEAKSNKPISLSLSPLLSKVIEKFIHDQRNELIIVTSQTLEKSFTADFCLS